MGRFTKEQKFYLELSIAIALTSILIIIAFAIMYCFNKRYKSDYENDYLKAE